MTRAVTVEDVIEWEHCWRLDRDLGRRYALAEHAGDEAAMETRRTGWPHRATPDGHVVPVRGAV